MLILFLASTLQQENTSYSYFYWKDDLVISLIYKILHNYINWYISYIVFALRD